MRAALAALLMLASPALGGECVYVNQAGQKIDWRGGDTIVVDPLYQDPATCKLTPIPDTNSFSADCGGFTDTFVTGASSRYSSVSDIVTWHGIFYWLECVKDKA